jgi:hypothetical protein
VFCVYCGDLRSASVFSTTCCSRQGGGEIEEDDDDSKMTKMDRKIALLIDLMMISFTKVRQDLHVEPCMKTCNHIILSCDVKVHHSIDAIYQGHPKGGWNFILSHVELLTE